MPLWIAHFFHFISFYFNPAVKPDRTNLQSAHSAWEKNGFSSTAARPLGRNGNSPFNCFITCSKCLLWPIEIIGREVVDPFVGPFVGAEPTTFSYSRALSSKAAFNGNTSLIIARNSNYAKNLFGNSIFTVSKWTRISEIIFVRFSIDFSYQFAHFERRPPFYNSFYFFPFLVSPKVPWWIRPFFVRGTFIAGFCLSGYFALVQRKRSRQDKSFQVSSGHWLISTTCGDTTRNVETLYL